MATVVTEKCRLVTRSDFDGLVCAALLKELGILDEIKFVHPKDMQDGIVELSERDITTNLPYVPGVRLANAAIGWIAANVRVGTPVSVR